MQIQHLHRSSFSSNVHCQRYCTIVFGILGHGPRPGGMAAKTFVISSYSNRILFVGSIEWRERPITFFCQHTLGRFVDYEYNGMDEFDYGDASCCPTVLLHPAVANNDQQQPHGEEQNSLHVMDRVGESMERWNVSAMPWWKNIHVL